MTAAAEIQQLRTDLARWQQRAEKNLDTLLAVKDALDERTFGTSDSGVLDRIEEVLLDAELR